MRKILIMILFLSLAFNVYAYRISRPPIFSLPWTEDQINQLNDTVENFWNLTNGEFNLDIQTTTKNK